MVFNGDSDNQDLCTLADNFVKTDDTDFPLTEKASYANMGVREIISWILSVYGGWTYDDKNNSDIPQATSPLVANQTNYTLPDILDLLGVSYLSQGSSSWTKLQPITLEQIQSMGYAEADFERVPGVPLYYRPIGNVIKIYPAANWSAAASLGIDFNRDGIAFTSASTTATPGFVSTMHEAVAVFMALMYAKINTLDSVTKWQKAWDGNEEVTGVEGGFKKRIKAYYRARFHELTPSVRTGRSDFVDQYT
jgi:hypothetical protein